MKRAMMVSALVLVMATGLLAGQFQPAQVPANAKWVVHVDVEGFLASQVGKAVMAAIPAETIKAAVAECQEKAGFDPTKDVKSVTVFGTEFNESGAAGVLEVKIDKAKAIAAASAKNDHKEAAYGELTIHEFTKKGAPAEGEKKESLFLVFAPNDRIVMAPTADAVKAATDVLLAKRDSLTKGGELAELAKPAAGSLFLVAAKDIALPDGVVPGDQAAVVKKLKTARMEVCEADKKFTCKSVGTATDADSAKEMREKMSGLLAMVGMMTAAGDDPKTAAIAEVIKGITVGGEGTAITITAAWDVEKVLAAIKAAAAAANAAPATGGAGAGMGQ